MKKFEISCNFSLDAMEVSDCFWEGDIGVWYRIAMEFGSEVALIEVMKPKLVQQVVNWK